VVYCLFLPAIGDFFLAAVFNNFITKKKKKKKKATQRPLQSSPHYEMRSEDHQK
jgi:hypothetical protein